MSATRTVAVVVFVFFAAGLIAADGENLVERALATLGQSRLAEWAYTQTTTENGTTVVARHDPSRPEGERWIVESVDGRPPTGEEREVYLARANASADSDEKGGGSEDDEAGGKLELEAKITPDTLELIEETDTVAVYRFQPQANQEGDEEMFRHLDATLRIVKDESRPYVQSIEMRSRKPFSPAFSVKVKQFATVMTYAPVGPNRVVLPLSMQMKMAGRAMLFKKLDESVDVVYADYRRK